MFLLLELHLGGCPHLDHGNTPGELGQALLEFLLIEIGGSILYKGLDLLDSCLNCLIRALAFDNGGFLFSGNYLSGPAQVINSDRIELSAQLLGDHRAPGEDGHILQHRLAAIAEARRLDRQAINGAP